MRNAFRALSPDPDYRYWFDPFWVRADPYRVSVQAGQTAEVLVRVRNFRNRDQAHHIEVHTRPGLSAEPAVLEGKLPSESKQAFTVRLKAETGAPTGVHIVAFDMTLDGQRLGRVVRSDRPCCQMKPERELMRYRSAELVVHEATP